MSSGADFFLKKTLGEDFASSLTKFELYKPGTRTTIDHEELRTALQIVPRTIMSLLIRELTPMAVGETKDIRLPVERGATLNVTKQEFDVYSGKIEEDGNNVATRRAPIAFQYRAIPGIGLVIMSAFELYDVDQIADNHPDVSKEMSASVQRMVEERMDLHTLINKVVDKKLLERDALQQLILARLTHAMERPPVEEPKKEEPNKEELKKEEIPVPKYKGSPLKGFLEEKSKKRKPREFHVEMTKGETVSCPDCGGNIFNGVAFSGCVCLGDDRERKVYIKKTEDGIKVRFGRGWDQENIEMLLETLWRRHAK
jgi:hypothetical protein